MRTKIVCTLGPASDDEATIRSFAEAGMTVARLNFSHGTYEDHARRHGHLFERRPFDRVESAGADEIVGSNFERKYRTEGRPFHAMTLVKKP